LNSKFSSTVADSNLKVTESEFLPRIESPQSGVARRTANVKYRLDQGMVERWVASAWLLAENRFRKISGHRDRGRWPRFPDAKPRLKSRRRK
jgi:hypothetical protein